MQKKTSYVLPARSFVRKVYSVLVRVAVRTMEPALVSVAGFFWTRNSHKYVKSSPNKYVSSTCSKVKVILKVAPNAVRAYRATYVHNS